MTRVVDTLPAAYTMALIAQANLEASRTNATAKALHAATEHCLAIGRTTPWGGTADYQPLFKRPPTYPRSVQVRGLDGVCPA